MVLIQQTSGGFVVMDGNEALTKPQALRSDAEELLKMIAIARVSEWAEALGECLEY